MLLQRSSTVSPTSNCAHMEVSAQPCCRRSTNSSLCSNAKTIVVFTKDAPMLRQRRHQLALRYNCWSMKAFLLSPY